MSQFNDWMKEVGKQGVSRRGDFTYLVTFMNAHRAQFTCSAIDVVGGACVIFDDKQRINIVLPLHNISKIQLIEDEPDTMA